ncbi:MAG: hypothetical protein JNL62_20445, partial [Bryobacterales bacterium]|nr:hypothetical protein [Bryobacterales bacterium]
MIGQTVSHYRIEQKLGEGGMGVVYRAIDLDLERPVAIKFLAEHLVGQEESQARFRREAKAAAPEVAVAVAEQAVTPALAPTTAVAPQDLVGGAMQVALDAPATT